MAVNEQYVANLVAELNADKEERERKSEFDLGEPRMVMFGVGCNYEEPYRYFVSRIDAEMFFHSGDYDYIEEINVY
jgi:hypothetical protein